MIVAAQVRASVAWSQRSGVRIGRTGAIISDPPIGTARLRAIRPSHLSDPVMTVGGTFGQIRPGLLRQRDGQLRRPSIPARVIAAVLVLLREEPDQGRLDGKPRVQRVDRRLGVDVG